MGEQIKLKLLSLALLVFLAIAGWQWLRAENELASHADTAQKFATYRADQAAVALRESQTYRAREARMNFDTTKAIDHANLQAAAAIDAAAGAATAAAGLRQRAQVLARACRGAAPGVAAAADPGPPAPAPGDLLADMLERVDAAAGELAVFAESASIAGTLCQRSREVIDQAAGR